MCGFIGLFTSQFQSPAIDSLRPALRQMARRGPDAEGLWADDRCALGHRRLAILDLDERASQPMHSSCGRYVIAFNGEIYNFEELRQELIAGGKQLRTNSD